MMPGRMPERAVPSSWWWAYFLVLTVLTVAGLLSGPGSFVEALLGVVTTFALVGLWGYMRQIAIGWKQFWAVYFCISLALNGTALVGFAITSRHPLDASMLMFLATTAVLLAPLHLALWRYAFRSPRVWR